MTPDKPNRLQAEPPTGTYAEFKRLALEGAGRVRVQVGRRFADGRTETLIVEADAARGMDWKDCEALRAVAVRPDDTPPDEPIVVPSM